MPFSPRQLLSHLEGLGITTRTVEHPALFTVTQSRELRGDLPGGHTKNLFLKDKKGRFFLVSCREDADVDLKRLHERLGASGRLSFGSAAQLMEKLGVDPGAVTLFGVVNDTAKEVTVAIDKGLLAFDDDQRASAHQHHDDGAVARRISCASSRRPGMSRSSSTLNRNARRE